MKKMSAEEFREHRCTTDAEITSKVPGVRSYVQSGDPAYAGVAVLEFDDAEGMRQALATPEWTAVLDDVPKFLGGDRLGIMTGDDTVVV